MCLIYMYTYTYTYTYINMFDEHMIYEKVKRKKCVRL